MASSFAARLASPVGLAAALFLAAACGTAQDSEFEEGTPPPGSGMPGEGFGPPGVGSSGTDPATKKLVVTPADTTLLAAGVPLEQAFTAKYEDGTVPTAVNWSLDDVSVGLVNKSGVFKTNGFKAGTSEVIATVGSSVGKAKVTVKVQLVDNPANVTPDIQAQLRTGTGALGDLKMLYPYDKTVFPRGLSAPLLQFGGTGETLYVKLQSANFAYETFVVATAPGRAQIPAAVWDGLVAAGGKDAMNVDVTVKRLVGGLVQGPVTERWTIAPGSLKGLVYYNSYNSVKGGGAGAVLRIKPGSDAEAILTGCTVCHSVSANGTKLVTGINWGSGNPLDSGSFTLTPGGATPVKSDTDGRKFSFGALTPDGKWFVNNAVPTGGQGIRGLSGALPSKLYDTDTGAEIPTPTFTSAVTYAMTPVFSPDGKRFAFNRKDASDGRTLSVMDFNGAMSPPTFSNIVDLVNVPSGVAGWPSFLPDGSAVLFHEGARFDTENAKARVKLVDLATKTVRALDLLNGGAPGASYLPYGEAEEADLDYEPTVLPVPVGGYYWVYFTSRRAYGNVIPGSVARFAENSARKKLWVAAIDADFATKATDPSHAAFYLPGQEEAAGNMRAFAALEPCKAKGQSCESGAECCDGFCRQNGETADGQPILQCIDKPATCANEDEKCTTAADCCDAASGVQCVNGRCARLSVPVK